MINTYYSPPTEERIYETVMVNGVRLSLIKGADNTYEVDALFSTNPQDYLNPLYMPGKKIRIFRNY